MTTFLIKVFLKDHKDLKSIESRNAYGKFAGIVGVFSNVLLTISKLIIGFLSGSIAVIADALNNLIDITASVITLIGFKLASIPEDENHPYGHARIEYLAGIFVSIFIVILGILLLISSVDKIINPINPSFSTVSIVVLFLASLVKLWQMLFYKKIGKLIDSITLIATSKDSRNDVITTLAVLLSALIWQHFGINLDGIFGALVSIFIIWSGISLIRETASPLLGEAPSKEQANAIIAITKEYPEVLGVHDLIIHGYGPGKTFASLHVEVDGDKDFFLTHEIVDIIENQIKAELGIQCVAHLDPVKVNSPVQNSLVATVEEALLPIEGIEDIHDLRIIHGTYFEKVIFDLSLSFNCKASKSHILSIAYSAISQKIENSEQSNPELFELFRDKKFKLVITFDRR